MGPFGLEDAADESLLRSLASSCLQSLGQTGSMLGCTGACGSLLALAVSQCLHLLLLDRGGNSGILSPRH